MQSGHLWTTRALSAVTEAQPIRWIIQQNGHQQPVSGPYAFSPVVPRHSSRSWREGAKSNSHPPSQRLWFYLTEIDHIILKLPVNICFYISRSAGNTCQGPHLHIAGPEKPKALASERLRAVMPKLFCCGSY